MTERKKIGVVGVDAGILCIHDPCYIKHDGEQKELNDYETLIKNLGQHRQLNYDVGHAGLGVVFQSGYGDGTYPVFATFNEEGRIMKVEVVMIEDE